MFLLGFNPSLLLVVLDALDGHRCILFPLFCGIPYGTSCRFWASFQTLSVVTGLLCAVCHFELLLSPLLGRGWFPDMHIQVCLSGACGVAAFYDAFGIFMPFPAPVLWCALCWRCATAWWNLFTTVHLHLMGRLQPWTPLSSLSMALHEAARPILAAWAGKSRGVAQLLTRILGEAASPTVKLRKTAPSSLMWSPLAFTSCSVVTPRLWVVIPMHVVMQRPSLFASHLLCLLLNANLGLGVMAQGGFEVQFRLLLIWFQAVVAGWCRMGFF